MRAPFEAQVTWEPAKRGTLSNRRVRSLEVTVNPAVHWILHRRQEAGAWALLERCDCATAPAMVSDL